MLHLTPDTQVVIIGPPGSGKTLVGNVLAETSGLPLYSTDRFLGDGHVRALYTVMEMCGDSGWIVEGMIGYRMLRKRKQLKLPAPDIVIQLDATDEQIEQSYEDRGLHCPLSHVKRFCAAHDSVLADYWRLDGAEPRIWVHSKSRYVYHLIGGGPAGTASNDSSR